MNAAGIGSSARQTDRQAGPNGQTDRYHFCGQMPNVGIFDTCSVLSAVQMLAGTQHDLVEALVFTRPGQVDLNIINGRVIVQDGNILTVDVPVS